MWGVIQTRGTPYRTIAGSHCWIWTHQDPPRTYPQYYINQRANHCEQERKAEYGNLVRHKDEHRYQPGERGTTRGQKNSNAVEKAVRRENWPTRTYYTVLYAAMDPGTTRLKLPQTMPTNSGRLTGKDYEKCNKRANRQEQKEGQGGKEASLDKKMEAEVSTPINYKSITALYSARLHPRVKPWAT